MHYLWLSKYSTNCVRTPPKSIVVIRIAIRTKELDHDVRSWVHSEQESNFGTRIKLYTNENRLKWNVLDTV